MLIKNSRYVGVFRALCDPATGCARYLQTLEVLFSTSGSLFTSLPRLLILQALADESFDF